MSQQRKNASEIWDYFDKTQDGKALCKTCKEIFSYKSTTANLKNHLKRKHVSLYTCLPSVIEKSAQNHNETATSESVVQQGSSSSGSIPSISASVVAKEPERNVGIPVEKLDSEVLPAKKRRFQNSSMDIFIPKKISKEQKKLIDNDVLDLCIDAFHPFSIVEERSFQKLMRWIPGYTLPSRKTLSNTQLSALYKATKERVFREVAEECDAMCISFDLWTSRKTESYIAVTGHYINTRFEFKTVLLDCCHFEGQHTAENIATEIKNVTDTWNVTNKINFAVSDNASNVTNAITHCLQWKHYGCYAHKLNLILQNALLMFEDSISKVKRIVAFFKKSCTATEKLDQQLINKNKTPKRLIQEVETRWNSTYFMLKRFNELKEEIKITLAILNKNLPIISEEEWLAFEKLCKILKPFEEITATMSGEKYVTGGDVIVMTRILKETCQRLKADEDNDTICSFIDMLLDNLDHRMGNVERSGTFSLCTFLDPRYKMAAFCDSNDAAQTKRRVQDKVQEQIAKQRKDLQQADETVPSSSSNQKSVWDIFDSFMIAETSSHQGTPLSKAIKEVQMYVDDEILPRKNETGMYNCPGKWWLAHKNVYPNLAWIYRNSCNVVSTSVSCERMFSKTGLIISDRRASLKTQKVRELMFLNVNMDQNRFM